MTKQKQFTHTADDRTPYTYLIGWSGLDKWYYGVRYAKGCHPVDFWVTYFTSSYVVDEFRKTHGDPDIIEIRKVFDCPKRALQYEQKILSRLMTAKSIKFLNKSGGNSLDKRKYEKKIYTYVKRNWMEEKLARDNKVVPRSAKQKLIGDFAYIIPLLVSEDYCLIKTCPVCNKLFDGRPANGKVYCSSNCANKVIDRSSLRQTYICISPYDVYHETSHLSAFCEEHELSYTCMGHVCNGKSNYHKGWSCFRKSDFDPNSFDKPPTELEVKVKPKRGRPRIHP